MVLPIGFFMPLPLAMMIPFMGIQSAVMAKQFGENFQYGKRRISAMSNDEFNKLTPQKIQENANLELKAMIPSMQQSIIEMNEFQKFVIQQFVQVMEDLIHAFPQALLDILGIDINLHEHENETTPPDGGGAIIPTLLHLTLSQISASNDQVLASWINNINDYDNQTQNWLIQEQQRRQESTKEKPSEEQITTILPPDMIASFEEKDMTPAGKRTRNFKGTIYKYSIERKLLYSHNKNTLIIYNWTTKWRIIATKTNVSTIGFADLLVNTLKNTIGASYVISFKKTQAGLGSFETYYLIKDR